MEDTEPKVGYPPVPEYPSGPASLQAAQIFYNAARQEINERCKFRDQVIIAVIGAVAGVVGFSDPARLSKGASCDNAPPGGFELGLTMLMTTLFLAVMSIFLARYLGYQNLKIAELGYYITSSPAYHFQLFATRQLDADIAIGKSEAVLLQPLVKTLNQSLAHWDRWARGVERDPGILRNRKLFSLEEVVGFLIVSTSLVGIGLLGLLGLRVIHSKMSDIATLGVWNWGLGRIGQWDFLASIVWCVTTAIAVSTPVATIYILRQGRKLKQLYARKRDDHHDPTIDPPPVSALLP